MNDKEQGKKTKKQKNTNKEAIWLYAELFSVITITDSHDKIYTTSRVIFSNSTKGVVKIKIYITFTPHVVKIQIYTML